MLQLDADFLEKANLAKAFNDVLTNNARRSVKKVDINSVSGGNKMFAFYLLLNASYSLKNYSEAEKWLAEIEKSGQEDWIRNAKKLKEKYAE